MTSTTRLRLAVAAHEERVELTNLSRAAQPPR
jgi:hypothetical protein